MTENGDLLSSQAGEGSTLDGEGDQYTAFQEWRYDRVFYEEEHPKLWLDLAESFYRSAAMLIAATAERKVNEEVEGIAGVFLFRHYLELALKHIIVAGRWVKGEGENAAREEVTQVKRIHNLGELWGLVLQDARAKIRDEVWQGYDTQFVERCILEFERIDPRGFAFRYAGHGVEKLNVNFVWLGEIMDHVYQVLEGIRTYLEEMYHQNEEYKAYLQAEYDANVD